ncbi:MAG: hypothetical protein QOG52_2677 [Frankiaceae bacterium]|jgi:hypothetical protein|nr:hypothetical protein [Frankiaceae bacterium]
MYRLALAAALASLVLSGCGSGSGSENPGAAKDSQAADASYFTAADTDAINKAASAVETAGAQASDAAKIAVCNKTKAYPAWRRCWHGLLDPYAKGLRNLANVFTSLQPRGFPEACRTQLAAAAHTFSGFAAGVDPVLAGIDSNDRARQTSAGKAYGSTLNAITQGFAQPFRDVTQVCYSPAELASINASPAPSP